MNVVSRRVLMFAVSSILLFGIFAASALAQTNDISSTPSSLTFPNTYVGKVSGSKSITITNLTGGGIVITTISFSCPGFGISSGVAPFSFGSTQNITHYSIFFQPTVAQTYSCDFILTLNDGTYLNVPLTGVAQNSTAVGSVSPPTATFSNQTVGSTSAPQTVTITNTGTTGLTLNTITLSPPSFTTNNITLPVTILAGSSLPVSVYYTPSEVTTETGAIDFTFGSVPDLGTSLTGSGVAASALAISTNPTLPQATQSAAYQYTLATSGGTGPYSWSLASGSSLPSGLSLSSTGTISGTLASSVATGNYTFTVQVTDSSTGKNATSAMTLGVFPNLADNCNDLSFNVPNTTTPMVALNDLATGTYQGYEGGLYPNGSNVRPASHDTDGKNFALGIQPLDGNGNYSPTGKYVLMAIGESTAQNEFNRFLPIANSDPTKNPYLVLVNGAQGGATPNNFTATDSVYWSTVLNNYLPQNGVTANQVVAIWMEDTDGIATGTFPTDVQTMQSEYETMMQTMHTLFPNLKLVYFSSRVYGGYSNGVGHPDNPEPYAYEVGYAVKWAIQDQLNGNSNLNYNPANGPVVAPWMSWGPYYWSNGMLGRNDGFIWDCADFSADGTHPSSQFGQLKVATQLLNFLKTDDTTIPWYLAPSFALTATGGNNQSGNVGSTLPTPLSVLASNLNGGAGQAGVTVTFSDGGAGGKFSNPTATTDSNGNASTSYTLPSTAKTVTITATSSGYSSATFTETATSSSQILTATGGNNQSGTVGTQLPNPLVVAATKNGNSVSGVTVTFSDNGSGGTFGSPVVVTGANGTASTTYTPGSAGTIIVTAAASGYSSASYTETATNVQTLTVNGGNNQSGQVGTTLPTALSVLATVNGNPASGVSVTFTDGGAGGVFGSPTAITGSNGVASSTYTLPSAPKTISVSATSSGYNAATLTETSVSSVSIITVVSGAKQTGTVGTPLPQALVVRAKNSAGKIVTGVPITFSDANAGGNFSPNPAITGSTGQASTTYTLPTVSKSISVTASYGSVQTGMSEKAVAAAPKTLAIVSGNNQSANPNTLLPKKLVVSVKDQYGNPVTNLTVNFTDNGAGGTFSTTTPVTNNSGQASVTYTTGSTAGTVTISATTSTLGPVNFTETVK
ncbi:MAG TPA: Ig-like domain-containing protein [Candidatus Sulfotelmatobacter sp.]|nr:Ig-like domain-containing protein [Candidatus Sulfotelmatobacter sp.]